MDRKGSPVVVIEGQEWPVEVALNVYNDLVKEIVNTNSESLSAVLSLAAALQGFGK